jgi:prolyl-tRNA synthetase
MTHADDDGLILPPRLAPKHVVLLPIYRSDDERADVLPYCESLKQELEAQTFADGKVQVLIDDRDVRAKHWDHIKKGVPLRAEIGPKDIANNAAFVGRRDTGGKQSIGRDEFVASVSQTLTEIQDNLFERAKKLREDNSCEITSVDDFRAYFTPANADKPEIHGGFAMCHFVQSPEMDELLKSLKVTIRCVPLEGGESEGTCVFTGKPATQRGLFAKAY